jgi:magnesium-transporting ATPase (P-type)
LKLEKLSKYISQHAYTATIICFLSLILFNLAFAFFGLDEDSGVFSSSMLLKIGNSAIVSVVLMMVAIPEGLPLAVSIAMALSVNNLKKDNILIKNLEAI